MEIWNYKPAEKPFSEEVQSDWNSTLVTAFNCVVVENNLSHKVTLETLVPVKFKNIIESLLYYQNGMVAGKYKIKIINENSNIISIEGCDLEIINFE